MFDHAFVQVKEMEGVRERASHREAAHESQRLERSGPELKAVPPAAPPAQDVRLHVCAGEGDGGA